MEGEGCNLLGCPKSTTVNVDTVTKNKYYQLCSYRPGQYVGNGVYSTQCSHLKLMHVVTNSKLRQLNSVEFYFYCQH